MLRNRKDMVAVRDRTSQAELVVVLERQSLGKIQKTEDELRLVTSNQQSVHQRRPFQCLQKISEILAP
jgi:hypothetical protein